MDHIIPKYVTLVIMMDHIIPKYVNNPGTPFLQQQQTTKTAAGSNGGKKLNRLIMAINLSKVQDER